MANWSEYRKKYEGLQTWLDDARKPGIITTGEWTKKYGRDTTGWEEHWLNKANKKYNRDAKDLGEYGEDELAELHYENWGREEGRTWPGQDVPEGQASSSSDDYFDTNKFQSLLNRLEASKGRQQRQKSLEGRRDIFATGLAGMMGNF